MAWYGFFGFNSPMRLAPLASLLLLGGLAACGPASTPAQAGSVARRLFAAEQFRCAAEHAFVDARSPDDVRAVAQVLSGELLPLLESVVRQRLASHGVSGCDPALTVHGVLRRSTVERGGSRVRLALQLELTVLDAGSRTPLARRLLRLQLASPSAGRWDERWVRLLASARRPVAQLAQRVLRQRIARRQPVARTPDAQSAQRRATGTVASANRSTRRGTCFAVAPEGLLATAYHVVAGATVLHVRLADGRRLPASVVKIDAPHDLALLRVRADGLAYLPLARGARHQLGQPVFTVGFPAVQLLGKEPRFTEGSISALSGPLGTGHLLQISVPLQPGNSGGPLIDLAGRLQGVITSIAAAERFRRATGALPQQVNFAIKRAHLRALLAHLTPPALPPTRSRSAAISRATSAVCSVEASRRSP